MAYSFDNLTAQQGQILRAYSSAWQKYRAKQGWSHKLIQECDSLWLEITEQLLSRNVARPSGNRVQAIKLLRGSTADTITFVAPCEYKEFVDCFLSEQRTPSNDSAHELIKLDCNSHFRVDLKEAKQIIDSYNAMLTLELQAREKEALQQMGKTGDEA